MNLVKSARQHLSSKLGSQNSQSIERQEIVAYSILCAYRDHFPDHITHAELDLIEKWKVIQEVEYDRFIKQRRLALVDLAAEWNKRKSFVYEFSNDEDDGTGKGSVNH